MLSITYLEFLRGKYIFNIWFCKIYLQLIFQVDGTELGVVLGPWRSVCLGQN